MQTLLLADPKADSGVAAATAYIDAAIRAGKPIAALRAQLIEQYECDRRSTELLIAQYPTRQDQGGAG